MKDEKTRKGKAWLKKETRPYKSFVFFLTVVAVFTTALSLAFAQPGFSNSHALSR